MKRNSKLDFKEYNWIYDDENWQKSLFEMGEKLFNEYSTKIKLFDLEKRYPNKTRMELIELIKKYPGKTGKEIILIEEQLKNIEG